MPGTRRSGRKPKPTALKELTGNPGKRKIPQGEPKPPDGVVTMPAWLKSVPYASEFWKKEVPKLAAMRVVTVVDELQLAALAQCYSLLRMTAKEMEKKSFRPVGSKTVIDGTGKKVQEVRAHPLIDKVKTLATTIQKLGSDYGMNPASRVRLAGLAEGAGAPKEKTAREKWKERAEEARGLRAIRGGKR